MKAPSVVVSREGRAHLLECHPMPAVAFRVSRRKDASTLHVSNTEDASDVPLRFALLPAVHFPMYTDVSQVWLALSCCATVVITA